jgi:hypothetical protein
MWVRGGSLKPQSWRKNGVSGKVNCRGGKWPVGGTCPLTPPIVHHRADGAMMSPELYGWEVDLESSTL